MRPEGVTLRRLEETDLEAVHGLSAGASWPHLLADWRLLHALGSGIVACENSGAIVGSAMAWRHGTEMATLGMVLVAPSHQGQGVGRRMMDAVLAEIGSYRLMLNSTEAGLRLYTALGFRAVGRILQQQGFCNPPPWPTQARLLQQTDRATVTALDAIAFSAPRPALLDRLLQEGVGVVIDGADGISGFAIRRAFGRGQVIGPLVARNETDAIALAAALAEQGFLRLDVPAGATRLSAWLSECGLPVTGGATTMIRGAWLPKSPLTRRFGLVSQALG
jgi:GNAT superfamily N-acetyltransferase